MLLAFFLPLGILESNEAELRAIKRAFQIWSRKGMVTLLSKVITN